MTTTTNSGISVTVLLSVLCLGLAMMLVGGWYFQSSLVELKEQQQSSLVELEKQQQETAQIVQQLKEKVRQQSKQLNELRLQLEIRQFKDNDQFTKEAFINNVNATTKHGVVKRSTNTSAPTERNLEILRGRDGRDGRDGLPDPRGMVGPPGPKEDTGVPGPKGERGGGVVYVRWGHNSCPDGGAQLVYVGRAGGSSFIHRGGGGNPQCLPLDPNFYKTISGVQNRAYMYGAKYKLTNSLVANSDNTDVPCAVCYVPTRNALYMIPAKYTCPSGWTREYFGYLMSEHYGFHRSQFSCVDHSLTPVNGSSYNHNGFLFYPVEGVCKSLPCPPYSRNKELSCAVCTK